MYADLGNFLSGLFSALFQPIKERTIKPHLSSTGCGNFDSADRDEPLYKERTRQVYENYLPMYCIDLNEKKLNSKVYNLQVRFLTLILFLSFFLSLQAPEG